MTRRNYIGSSEAAMPMGLSPYGKGWLLFARKSGLVPDMETTPAMRVGNLMEDALLDEAQRRLGRPVTSGPLFDEEPFYGPHPLASHPDGLALPDFVVECKVTHSFDGWGEDGSDVVPAHYRVQCQVHMTCCKVSLCYLIALCPLSREVRMYRIEHDEDFSQEIINTARKFWEDHIETGIPPEVDDTEECSRGLASAYEVPTGKETVEATDEDRQIIADLVSLKAAMSKIDGEARFLENRLKESIGDSYGLRVDGKNVAIWYPVAGRVTIDAARLRKDHPEIAAEYEKVGEPSRVFRLLAKSTEV